MASLRAPWWMYIVAASLLGNFALNIYSYLRGPEPPFSQYTFARDALVVEEVLPDSAADRAGIQALDRVLAIDGSRVRGLGQWDALRINFEVGKPYRLQVERDGKPFDRVMTLQAWSWSHQTQYRRIRVTLEAASALLTLLVAFLVAFSRPYDWVARIGALSIALLGGLANLYGTSAIVRRLPILVAAPIWWPQIGAFIFPALFFTFCTIFPRQLFRSRWTWLANVPSLFFLLPISGFALFTFVEPLGEFTGPDWITRLGASLLFAYISAGLVALILNYRRLDDLNQKRRIRVLVTGSLVGYLALVPYAVFFTMRTPAQSGAGRVLLSWPALLLATVVYQAFPLSWAYAILRHRLFDIRVILRQGLQYALARRVVLGVVPALGIVLLADLLLHGQQPLVEILGTRGWIYVVLGGLASVASLKRQSWLEALDRRFFRERYDAQRVLREVVEEVRGARSFDQVAPQTVLRIEAALHPEFAALLLRERGDAAFGCVAIAPQDHAPPSFPTESKLMALVRLLGKPLEVPQTGSGWLREKLPREETELLRQARIEWIVPVATVGDQSEALLVLGPKRSEEPYTREDQDLLAAISASLALLLEKPAHAAPVRSDVFEECPRCGTCYDSGATQCARDAAPLTPVVLPRLLNERYLLQQRLGRGGMGTVYAASDIALERRVAVKVIREDLVGSAEAAERFRREARVAAGFAHPHVVTVHDFGIAAGNRAFLVMELLDGASLREELRHHGRLPPPRTLDLLRGVTAAVDVAHQRQLIHRDLKPENIFLARQQAQEVAKVLDFGVAKLLPSDTRATAELETGAGALMGTLRYMSPEQLRGEPAQAASDLWALAVVSYEMLVGKHPFDRGIPGEVTRAILAGRFASIAEHCPDAPARWQTFFTRALALEPQTRPASAGIFLSELAEALA